MGYGILLPDQVKAVRELVRGQRVHDLGAGDLQLSKQLVKLGAKQVVAIDHHTPSFEKSGPKIQVERKSFRDWAVDNPHEGIKMAFVSWPMNHFERTLLELVQRAETVMYLGKNTDGSACGSPELFRHFLSRQLLVYIPHRENTLCVYGGSLDQPRQGQREETAVNSRDIWAYQDA